MRIHTNTLTDVDIRQAAEKAHVRVLDNSRHGSRSRARAFNVTLSGDSPSRTQANRDEYAATWDQWGIFLAELFRRDVDMICDAYKSPGDFHWQTGERFVTLTYAQQHIRHRFFWDGKNDGKTVTQVCSDEECGAVKRWQR